MCGIFLALISIMVLKVFYRGGCLRKLSGTVKKWMELVLSEKVEGIGMRDTFIRLERSEYETGRHYGPC